MQNSLECKCTPFEYILALIFLDDHWLQWRKIKRGDKKIFRVNRKLKERQLGWSGDKVVMANNVKGGNEDGDQLSQGKYSVGSQLVALWPWNGPNYSISPIIRGRLSHNLLGVNDKFPRPAQDKVILNCLPNDKFTSLVQPQDVLFNCFNFKVRHSLSITNHKYTWLCSNCEPSLLTVLTCGHESSDKTNVVGSDYFNIYIGDSKSLSLLFI